MVSYPEFVKVMGYLAALYPRFALTEATIDAYYTILRDLDGDLLKRAAEQVGADSTFFPAAAEIRKSAFNLKAKAEGIPSPAEAWGEVMAHMRAMGSWGYPSFSNRLIERAVEGLGGWKTICASENNIADRAHFLKIYTSLLERHDYDEAMLPEVSAFIADLAALRDMAQLEEGEHEDNAGLARVE